MIVICFHYSFFQIKNPTFHARDMVTITLIRFMLVLQILKKYTEITLLRPAQPQLPLVDNFVDLHGGNYLV